MNVWKEVLVFGLIISNGYKGDLFVIWEFLSEELLLFIWFVGYFIS